MERIGPSKVDREVASVWLPFVLILAAIGLGLVTAQLPFTAGRPLRDLFAPVGALVFAGLGASLALQQRRRVEGGRRGWLLTVGVFGILIAVAAAGLLLIIFGLCGAYWMRTSC